jgi:hypothetical protein
MKKKGHRTTKRKKTRAFVVRAERAMRRAAQNVRVQHRAFNVPVVVWENRGALEAE